MQAEKFQNVSLPKTTAHFCNKSMAEERGRGAVLDDKRLETQPSKVTQGPSLESDSNKEAAKRRQLRTRQGLGIRSYKEHCRLCEVHRCHCHYVN